jgi:hypothetical protein
LVGVKSGTFAKVPRGYGVLGTTVIDLADLPRPSPDKEPPPSRRQPDLSSGSWSPLAITPADLADLPRLQSLAASLVPGGGGGHGKAAVSDQDVAIYLLLLRFFEKDRYPNGTLPSARFKGLWGALYGAGQVSRAFSKRRFAAITKHLTGAELLRWENHTFDKGRARKWGASPRLLQLIAPPRPP